MIDAISNLSDANVFLGLPLDNFSGVRLDDATGSLLEEYAYDADGQRVKKVAYASDGSNETTLYVNPYFVVTINDSGVYNPTYYYAGAELVAEKRSNGEKLYYHPDHLGSTSLVTNQSGDVVEEIKYNPFGGVLSESFDSRYTYTGQEQDKGTDLMYFGARYYTPYLRMFTQPDSDIPQVYNPQDLNRYSYVRNNPYTYKDPDGNSPALVTAAIGVIAGGSIGFIASAATQWYQTGSFSQISWSDAGKSAGIGAVAGGVAGLTLGLGTAAIGAAGLTEGAALTAEGATAAVAGSAAGQARRATENVIEKKTITQGLGDPKDLGVDALIGLGTWGIFRGGQAAIKQISKPEIEILEYEPGMPFGNGNIYSSVTKKGSTVIIHENYEGFNIDYHYHPNVFSPGKSLLSVSGYKNNPIQIVVFEDLTQGGKP